jgi:hypothetical protein
MSTTTLAKPRRKSRQPFTNRERRLKKARAFALSDDFDSFDQFLRWFHDQRAFSAAEQTPHIWRLLLAEYRKAAEERRWAEQAEWAVRRAAVAEREAANAKLIPEAGKCQEASHETQP